jgi:uncharacterized protein (DUF39 family)
MNVGIGVPIPILNEEMAQFTGVSDDDILVPVVDYGVSYPETGGTTMTHVSYGQLRSGEIEFQDKKVTTSPLSSYSAAKEIAEILKSWITAGDFLLGVPQETLPSVPFDGFRYDQ